MFIFLDITTEMKNNVGDFLGKTKTRLHPYLLTPNYEF